MPETKLNPNQLLNRKLHVTSRVFFYIDKVDFGQKLTGKNKTIERKPYESNLSE